MNENENGTQTKLGSFDELSNEERLRLAKLINEAGLTWHADAYLDDDGVEVTLVVDDGASSGS